MKIVLLSVLLTTTVYGGMAERIVCPNITEDAKILLSSIQTLQDELKKTPECQAVTEKVATMSSVLRNKKWVEVKELFKTESSPALEGNDIVALSDLANEAAYALTDAVALLSGGSNHCMPKKNPATFLSTLSGVTKEVSTVVGNVTGPYGQAVSLVGNLLSATISGVDKLYKQNKLYDFRNAEEELLFMNQFCSFTQAQQDITDFLELEKKEEELKKLEVDYLTNTKIKALIENCPECNAFKSAWDAKELSDKIISRIIEDANIVNVSLTPSSRMTFTRCAEINRAVYSENSDLNQFINLLEGYTNPLMSSSDAELINDIVLAVKDLPFIYPRYQECIKMDNQAISIKFNDFIRDDILTLNETIFGQQMRTFQFLANRKYQDPNGDYIAVSLDRVKWARSERQRVIRKIKEPNYKLSKQIVIEQRDELRERILRRLMPHYLKFRFKRNKYNIKTFMKQFESFKKRELKYFGKKLGKELTSLESLSIELKDRPELARYFVSAYDNVFNDSRAIILEVANNKRYCDYLLYARSMVPENRKICDQRSLEMESAMKDYDSFNDDLKVIIDFDAWADKNLSIQSTYVKDYSDHIRDWNIRGDDRWDLID